MLRTGLVAIACLSLAACTDTVISNGTIGGAWGRHRTPVTYTSADVRMISERVDPRDHDHTLVCTEPLPDVAKALSGAAQARGQGSGGGPVSVTLGGGASSAESLLELAGRSSALLGLRDGLYRACEAYANGAIGDDAYSLILGHYGSVMVTLFLAQDLQDTARAGGTVQSPSITLGDSTTTQVTPAAGAPPQGAAAGHAAMSVPAGGLPTLLHDAAYDGAPLAGGLAPWTGEAAPLPLARRPARIEPSAATTPPGSPPDPPRDQPSAAAAQAIGRLADAFFASGRDSLHTLMVACINDGDTTRLRARESVNAFLLRACPVFYDPDRLRTLAAILDRQDGPVPLPAAGHTARHAR